MRGDLPNGDRAEITVVDRDDDHVHKALLIAFDYEREPLPGRELPSRGATR